VFDFVARSGAAISRDAAADAVGISGRMAAFHLDRPAATRRSDGQRRGAHHLHGDAAGPPQQRCCPPAPPTRADVVARVTNVDLVSQVRPGHHADDDTEPVDDRHGADAVGRRAWRAN
jgi:hypothetical protein